VSLDGLGVSVDGGAMVEDTVAPSREARATLIPSHERI